MNLLALLFTLLAWLPLAVPVGILAALFLMYSKLNKGNLTSVGPLAHPPSLEPWHGQEKNFGQSGYGTSGSPTVSGAVAWTSLCSAGKICSATSPHSATNASVKAEKPSADPLHALSQHFLLGRVYDHASASLTTQAGHESIM